MDNENTSSLRGSNRPVVPLPPIVGNPEAENTPVVPLPPIVGNPEVAPPDGPITQFPAFPGVTLPVFPVFPVPPIAPDNTPPADPGVPAPGFCNVRFLHAAINYDAVNISVGARRLVSGLSYGNISAYSAILDGFRTFTVTLCHRGKIILRKTFSLRAGEVVTLALVNTVSNVDLISIPDYVCNNRPRNRACFRVVNLSPNSPPLDVMLADGRLIYTDVQYKEVTPFKRVRPGRYGFIIGETPQGAVMPLEEDIEVLSVPGEEFSYSVESANFAPVLSFVVNMHANVLYTVYIIGRVSGTPALSTLLAENR